MRRIRNSVKALIVSLCLVVILAGSIVGVVLTTRNKGKGGGDPTSPTSPVTPGIKYELTEDQKALVESINKNASTSVEIATEFNPSDYVDEEGNNLSLETVTLLNDKYISGQDNNNNFFVYAKKTDKLNVYYENILNSIDLNLNGELVSRKCFSFDGRNISFNYVYDVGETFTLASVVYDIENLEIVKLITVESLDSNYDDNFTRIIISNNLYFSVIDSGLEKYELSVFSFSSSQSLKTYNVTLTDIAYFNYENKLYHFGSNGKYYFGYYDENGLNDYEYDFIGLSNIFYCRDNIFVELKNGSIYSYKMINSKTSKCSDFVLDSGYSKAIFTQRLSDYYEVYMMSDNTNALKNKMVYFNNSDEKIIEYEADSYNDVMIYFENNRILTNKGILSSKNSIDAEFVLEFNSIDFNYSFVANTVNNGTFVLKNNDTGLFRIVNIKGEFLYDQEFEFIKDYGDGYYFAYLVTDYYIIDIKNNKKELITDFAKDNKVFISNGGGYYLTGSVGHYTLYNFKGELVLDDILEVSYSNLFDRTVLIVETKDDKKHFIFNQKLYIEGTVNYGFDLYYSSGWIEGTNYDYQYEHTLGEKKDGFKITIKADSGYVVTSGTAGFNRNGVDFGNNISITFSGSSAEGTNCGSCSMTSFGFDETEQRYKYVIEGDGATGMFGVQLDVNEWYSSSWSCNTSAITCKITFSDCEKDDATATYPNKEDFGDPAAKTGYTFTGYTSNSDYIIKDGKTTFTCKPIKTDQSYSLTACWEANTYTVQYSNIDDEWDSFDAKYDESFSVNVPERNAYTFTGWNITGMDTCTHTYGSQTTKETSIDKTTEKSFKNLRSTSGAVTFTATWKANKYDISFVFGVLSSSSPATAADVLLIDQFKPEKEPVIGYTYGQITQGALNAKFIVGGTTYESNPATKGATVEITHEVSFKYFLTSKNTSPLMKDLYSWSDVAASSPSPSSFANFNPANENCQFSVYNAPLQICDWAYIYGSNSSGTPKYNLISAGGETTLLDYLYAHHKLGNNNDGKENLTDEKHYDVVLYAVYKPKEYKAYYEVEYDNGRGSLKNEGNNDVVNFTYQDQDLLIGADLNASTANGGEFSLDGINKFYKPVVSGSDNVFNIYSSNSPTFKIATNWGEDYYYDFDKIVISNFGYKISDTDYGYATIEFTKNENGFLTPVVTSIKKKNSSTGTAVTIPSSLETVKFGDITYYFIGDKQENINGFRLEMAKTGTGNSDALDGTYNACNLYFYNLGYAGDHVNASHEITQSSVTGKGTYGFTIKVYLKSNYTKTDTIKIDGVTNTTASKAEKDSSSLLMTNVTSVYQTTVYNPNTLNPVTINYFWLNGKRVALIKENEGSYVSALETGYYTIKYDRKFGIGYSPSTDVATFYKVAADENARFFECYTAEYLRVAVSNEYSYVLSELGEQKQIIYFQVVNHGNNVKGDVYYMGGQDPWPSDTRPTIASQDLNYTNFNSTQLLAITPEQEKIKLSTTVNISLDTDRYELKNYLSKLNIDGTEINFGYSDNAGLSITKAIVKDGDKYSYADFNKIIVDSYNDYFENTGKAISQKTSGNTGKKYYSYIYMGFEYEIKQAYEIIVVSGSGENERKYILYFGVRSENTDINKVGEGSTGYDYRDNYVMYFLYSNVGKNNHQNNITAYFKYFDKKVTTTIEDAESDFNKQIYSASPAVDDRTADVQYGYFGSDNKIQFVSVYDGLLFTGGNDKNISYYDNINPNDLIVVRITPNDGFVLESVSLKLKNSNSNGLGTGISNTITLFDFSLGNLSLNVARGGTPDQEHAFIDTTGGVLSYMYQYKNSANSLQGSSFYSFASSDELSYFGIYCTNREDSAAGAKSWNKTLSDFESIYFLIGGIYHDIDIEVKTASYIEFSFEANGRTEAEKLLGYESVYYEERADGYYPNTSGTYLLSLRDASDLNLSPSNSPNVSTDGGFYTFQNHIIYYYKEPDCAYIKVPDSDAGRSILSNSTIKKYLLNGTATSSSYSYIEEQESYDPVYLKELTHLSLLVKNDGDDWVRLGNEFNNYDATLVKRFDSGIAGKYFFRIIFIGKSQIFSGGVKIFASGEDYSLYFTNGKLANDNLSSATGLNTGRTAFQLLSDLEGRQEDVVLDESHSISLNPYTPLNYEKQSGYFKNITYKNYLTYMQIDNLENFFAHSVYNIDGKDVSASESSDLRIDYEFARKYYFSVRVNKNEITMNVNSYITNDNLRESGVDGGNVSTKIDYGASAASSFGSFATTLEIKSDNRAKNNLLDNTSNNGLKFNGLNYNSFAPVGFAYSVTDGIDAVKTGLEAAKSVDADDKISTFNSKSKIVSPYMWVGENTLYQLDYVNTKDGFNYSKKQSWFNDTILTNIDYTFKNEGVSKTLNWQETTKNYGENTGNADPNHKVSGYGISYTYHSIPGYYLQYIVIETVEYGILYLNVNDLLKKDKPVASGYLNGEEDSDNNSVRRLYYYLERRTNVDGTYEYFLKFAEDSDVNNKAGLNSIGILSNNFTVSFFSNARSIEIKYHENNDSVNISSKSLAQIDDTDKTQEIYYDNLTVLDPVATMPGYTFIGWGSQSIVNESEEASSRFDSTNLIWKTDSAWMSVVGNNYNTVLDGDVLGSTHDYNYVNYFSFNKRSNLLQLGKKSYGYDFYVKSSSDLRKETTGYFITDTGSVASENYNFWSVYANLFTDPANEHLGIKTDYPLMNENLQINMYAIWKANVYSVEINMNDVVESNGSTSASMAFGRKQNGETQDLLWNGYVEVMSKATYGVSLNNKAYANQITAGYPVSDDEKDKNIYYCYVTFDKNDWYILSAQDVKSKVNNAAYSLKGDVTTSFLYKNGTTNRLDFIIDRYGYSWLGWFSKKYESVYQGYYGNRNSSFQEYYSDDGLVFGSDYFYYINEYSSVRETGYERVMPYLRYDTYNKAGELHVNLYNFEKSSDVNINNNGTNDNATDDFLETSNELYSEFVYKNELYYKNRLLEDGKSYVYHYDYKTGDMSIDDNYNVEASFKYVLYKNNDYLNGSYVSESPTYTLLETNGFNKDNYGKIVGGSALVYFDTSLSLASYDGNGEDIEGVESLTDGSSVNVLRRIYESGKTNYRYLTIYAHWSTNNYKVTIDYRDETSKSIENLGSTDVTNTIVHGATGDAALENREYVDSSETKVNQTKDMNSTFFDDDFFDYILKKSIPTRVGYDFLGWSFFYRDPGRNATDETQVQTLCLSDELNKRNGELYKYNGYTYVSSSGYTLNGALEGTSATIYNNYFAGVDINGDGYINDYDIQRIAALYTTGSIDMIDSQNGTVSKYNVLGKNLETFGDEDVIKFGESDAVDRHYIYIFAMWRAQTYTINVGLNIDTHNRTEALDDLANVYDHDSGYSIGFYDSYNNADEPQGWVGVNSLFLRQRPNENNIYGGDTGEAFESMNNYSNVYSEIVSNMTFVITFDELFSTARFIDPNYSSKYYKIEDLFAVSAGHYLLGWLYTSNDKNAKLIADEFCTTFGYNSNLVKKEDELNRLSNIILADEDADEQEDKFDETWHNKLKNSNYKDVNVISNANTFEDNNTKNLNSNDQSGASSAFGYVKSGSQKYYIQTEYSDTSNDYKSDTHYLTLSYDGQTYYVVFYQNTTNNVLLNDFNYLYFKPNDDENKYIVRFYEKTPGTMVAYYVPNTSYAGMVELDLRVAVFSDRSALTSGEANLNNYIQNPNNNLVKKDGSPFYQAEFLAHTTRQFTIYALWDTREDMSFTFTNGNNGEYDEANLLKSNISNPGLAGFVSFYNENKPTGATTPDIQTWVTEDVGGGNYLAGEDIKNLSTNFTFYDDVGFDLLPFFNGRFISKIYFDFDRIESSNQVKYAATTHTLVRYRLELTFTWVNADKPEDNNVRVSSLSLKRLKLDDNGEFIEDVTRVASTIKSITNDSTGRIVIQIDDSETNAANANAIRSYLSILDNDSFTSKVVDGKNEGLFTITKYGSNPDRTGIEGSTYGRRDVNMLSFNLDDLISSANVTCFYSVQTYQLTINHIFDENGDTLDQDTIDSSKYTSQFTELDYNAENSLESDEVYSDVTPTGDNQKLATIPKNLVSSSTATDFNVPYGYFIYGTYYSSELVGYRPMDDYYLPNVDANYGGDTKHPFDGFNYLYQEANYTKGQGGSSDLLLDGNGTDLYFDQGSPLLGSAATFPLKSIRYSKSFYLFKGWFEDSNERVGDFIVFDSYDIDDEASYIDRNITLYGYYYSNNTPTNIQFYTWNNDWNENSPAYLPYTNNKEEYTLSSSEENSSYTVTDGYLTPITDALNLVDVDGRAIFKSRIEFGVDSSGFSNDKFNSEEIAQTDVSLLNSILKTYWYYDETYTVRYADVPGIGKVYVKFDKEIRSEYTYVSHVSSEFSGTSHDGMIVHSEEYEKYVEGTYGLTAGDVPVLAWIDYDTGEGDIATIVDGGAEITLTFEVDHDKYYFRNPNDGLIYLFTNLANNTVINKFIPDKNVFYIEYEDGRTVRRKVKVMSSNDMSSASIRLWDESLNGGLGDYSATSIPLSLEEMFVYGDRFIGAELYAVIGNGDQSKYYKYYRIEELAKALGYVKMNGDADLDVFYANSTDFVKNNKPRYYVEIGGTRYYTFITKTPSNNGGAFTGLYDKNGDPYNISFNITTLNNYYVLMDGVYYAVEFENKRDSINVISSVVSDTISYVLEPETNIIVKHEVDDSNEVQSNFARVDFGTNKVTILSNNQQITLNHDVTNNTYSFEYWSATYTFGDIESVYVNPMINANTVQFMRDGELKTYYFNYELNSRTSGLYEDILVNPGGVTFSNQVLFSYNIYTPINQNYTLKAALSDGMWEAADITLNAFPSINMDYWINNPDYVLLGYINVSETDIAAMKRSDDSNTVTISEYMYVKDLSAIVVEEEYADGGEYTIFATVESGEVRLYPGGANEKTVPYSYDASKGMYYFFYEKYGESDTNLQGYYYFSIEENNTIEIYQELSGGQVFTAFSNYISDIYPGDAKLDLRLALERAISGKILNEFNFNHMIKAPMFVESYQLSTKDYKTVEAVTMRITCQFVFTHEELEQYGLLAYCGDGGDLTIAVNIGTASEPEYKLTISTTYNYTFNLISTKTLISANIWALPVYVPDVIKFVGQEIGFDPDTGDEIVLDNGCVVNVSGTTITFDYMKMDVSHFDLETFRKYGSDHIWNRSELTPEMINNADYLQFVMLNSAQYQQLIESSIGCDVMLDSIISKSDLLLLNDLTVKSLADASLTYTDDVVSSAELSFDLTGNLDGDYYIFAFYYAIDTLNNIPQYVFRTKIENVVIETTLTYEQLKAEFDPSNTGLSEEELIALAEAEMTAEGSSIHKYGELSGIRYNKHINRVSDNILKVSVVGGVIDSYTVIDNQKAQ